MDRYRYISNMVGPIIVSPPPPTRGAREQAHVDALVRIKQGCWMLAAPRMAAGGRSHGEGGGWKMVRTQTFGSLVHLSSLKPWLNKHLTTRAQRVTSVKDMGEPECVLFCLQRAQKGSRSPTLRNSTVV